MYIILYIFDDQNDVQLLVKDEECTLKIADIIPINNSEYAVTKISRVEHPDYEFIEYKVYLSFVQKEGEEIYHGLH